MQGEQPGGISGARLYRPKTIQSYETRIDLAQSPASLLPRGLAAVSRATF